MILRPKCQPAFVSSTQRLEQNLTDPIPIQAKSQVSVANAMRILLREAERGDYDALMFVASRSDGGERTGVCGRYSSDLGAAVEAAQKSFKCLLGHTVCLDDQSTLPRRLRKESANDQACRAVACSMRR